MSMMQFANFPGFSGFRAGNKNGGEYHGKCPGTGPECVDLDHNDDRLRVWPHQGAHGTFSCRKCGRGGDAIQFLRDFEGLGYLAACARLGIDPKTGTPAAGTARPQVKAPAPPAARQLTIHPVEHPAPLWIEHAEKFVSWCHEQLLAHPEQLAYLAGRGIDRAAVAACRLGWNPQDAFRAREAWGLPKEINQKTGRPKRIWLPAGVVIPVYRAGVLQRVRIRRPAEEMEKNLPERKYHRVDGSVSTTMILGEAARAFAVVEAELDAIAIFAAAADLVGAVSIETLEGNLDAGAAALLSGALVILNALDADDPKSPGLQRAIAKWAATFGPVIRWPVPEGKDPGEAFKAGVDLRTWMLAGLPPVFHVAARPVDSPGQPPSSGMVKEEADFATTTADEAAPVASNEVEKQEGGATAVGDEEVAELGRLLLRAKDAVWIIKEEGGAGLEIRPNLQWKKENRVAFARICRLVFYSEACGRHLDRHPALVIKGSNW